jgi:hypothetical protein
MKDRVNPKQFALDLIGSLPDRASIAEVREQCDLLSALLESYEDEGAGRLLTHEQVVESLRDRIAPPSGRS